MEWGYINNGGVLGGVVGVFMYIIIIEWGRDWVYRGFIDLG